MDNSSALQTEELTCDHCGEPFTFMEEMLLLEIGEYRDGVFQIRLGDNGDYEYLPYYMHTSCWESIWEEIQEQIIDRPSIEHPSGVTSCIECGDSIVAEEPFIIITFCEVQRSRRNPTGVYPEILVRLKEPSAICIKCIAHVIDLEFSAWEQLIEDLGYVIQEEDDSDDVRFLDRYDSLRSKGSNLACNERLQRNP